MSIYLSQVWQHFAGNSAIVRSAMDWVIGHKGLGLEALATQREALLSKRDAPLRDHISGMVRLRMNIALATLAGSRAANVPDLQLMNQ